MATDQTPVSTGKHPLAERLATNQRGQRYGEVLVFFERNGVVEADVYGTQLIDDCPQELWEGLDANVIAGAMGAFMVKLNGPRQWVLDGLASNSLADLDLERHEFKGIAMRLLAVVRFGNDYVPGNYIERHVDRKAVWFFDAGKKVYELVSPDGRAYVMQALCQGVDTSTTLDTLDTLGDRLSPPEGWSYRIRVPDEELIVDTTEGLATILQDEFENTYTLAAHR